MKKLAIGCGVALLVVVVLGGALLFYGYTRFVRPMTAAITEMSQVGDIEKDVRNTSSFTPPPSNDLTEDMVGRFVKVQEAMQARLGSRMDELKKKYDEIERAMKTERREASVPETMTALKDLAKLIVDAKRAQVEALNQAGFSVKEYEWIRQQVYAAVGMAAAQFDMKDIQRIARQSERDREAEEIKDVPARNKELVAPYQKKLEEWAPLAFFGL